MWDDRSFVYVPSGLDTSYLESVVSRVTGREVGIASCVTTNLCVGNWGEVSNSGATVLRLSLTLQDGDVLDLVVKILSPDAVNLFKIDCRFDARQQEIAWSRWWGRQNVPFVSRIYDTRCDPVAREFWILQEYFPTIGWDDVPVAGMKHFVTTRDRLLRLFGHAADIHAYSRNHIGELKTLLPASTPAETLDILSSVLDDADFQALVGLQTDECRMLEAQCLAVEQRPHWVDAGDLVCVSNDLAPDNFALRRTGDHDQIVTFDWGTAHLAPMELDIDLLLRRIQKVNEDVRSELLDGYLKRYVEKTGHSVDREAFRARMPWVRLLFHQRMIADHVRSLRWVPHQTRSKELMRLFIGLCDQMLTRLWHDLPPSFTARRRQL
jgi:hypothetical protein